MYVNEVGRLILRILSCPLRILNCPINIHWHDRKKIIIWNGIEFLEKQWCSVCRRYIYYNEDIYGNSVIPKEGEYEERAIHKKRNRNNL